MPLPTVSSKMFWQVYLHTVSSPQHTAPSKRILISASVLPDTHSLWCLPSVLISEGHSVLSFPSFSSGIWQTNIMNMIDFSAWPIHDLPLWSQSPFMSWLISWSGFWAFSTVLYVFLLLCAHTYHSLPCLCYRWCLVHWSLVYIWIEYFSRVDVGIGYLSLVCVGTGRFCSLCMHRVPVSLYSLCRYRVLVLSLHR